MTLLDSWPTARLAELHEVISNVGEMVASPIVHVSIVVLYGNTLMLEQRSHDVPASLAKLNQNGFEIFS